MRAAVTFLFVLYVVEAVGMMAAAIPFIRRRVKPNLWSGFRISETLRDEATWYRVNAQFGKWLFVAGAIFALAAVAPITYDEFARDVLTGRSRPEDDDVVVVVHAGCQFRCVAMISAPPSGAEAGPGPRRRWCGQPLAGRRGSPALRRGVGRRRRTP